jgi:putative DNA primase/helicase
MSTVTEFQNALIGAGVFLAADVHVTPDGQLHRAHAADDKPGALSIWYVFHPDAPASGVAGNWRTGARLTWCSKRMTALSATERAIIRERIEQDRKQHEAEKRDRHSNASERASKIWSKSPPAAARHPYLDRKGIIPGIARQSGPALVLPIVDFGGALHGLQFIAEDGGKKFLSGMSKAGHFIPVSGLPDGTKTLYIAEGYATSATLQTLKPDVCHVAALDCGNLASVAQEARKRWPDISLVICPDFDAIGQEKGKTAAIASRAKILPMPANIPDGCTDWNDWKAARKGVQP